jgi:hypothetical protein
MRHLSPQCLPYKRLLADAQASAVFGIDFAFQYENFEINTLPNYQEWAKNRVLIFSIS